MKQKTNGPKYMPPNWYLVKICFYELTEYAFIYQRTILKLLTFNLSNILNFISILLHIFSKISIVLVSCTM